VRHHIHVWRAPINENAKVLDDDLRPIEGLYAAGELVGGLFYFNYPGGSGLMSGAVFASLASWASDAEGWFESLSGWHFLVAGGAMLVVLALAIR
jgi:hypothetical protein